MANKYIDIGQAEAKGKHRAKIIDGIQAYVEEQYGAETSQINLNSWKTRFDIDIHDPAALEEIIENVNNLLRDSEVKNATLIWEAIPTKKDKPDGYDGYRQLGEWGEKHDQFADWQFPIKAFKVTVELDRSF